MLFTNLLLTVVFLLLFFFNSGIFGILLFYWSLQCRRPGFNPWVGKIPWRRAWQPTSVFLPGESPGTEEPGVLQSIGSSESDTAEWLSTEQHMVGLQNSTSFRSVVRWFSYICVCVYIYIYIWMYMYKCNLSYMYECIYINVICHIYIWMYIYKCNLSYIYMNIYI